MADERRNYGSGYGRTTSRSDEDQNRRGRFSSRSEYTGDEYRSDELRFESDDERGADRSYGQQGEYRSRASHLDDQFRPSSQSDRWQRRMPRGDLSSGSTTGFYGTERDTYYGTRASDTRVSHIGKGPKGWKRSDEKIREEVCERLERDSHIDASDIEVSVKEGIVTLSGKVEDRPTKRHAEDIVESLTGVKDVRNDLTVDQSFFTQAKEMIMGKSDTDKSMTSKTGGKTVPH
ncbi:MAG: BON domain-containing protein [Bdellovibrionaceae bacterium]|nr:BON domain-containing protein [Pseudobdellovibrionaceae bacterium]